MTVEVFDASTTWTCPAGVTVVKAECWGGGGGGSNGTAATAKGGAGGGGGAYSVKNAVTVVPGNGYAVSVGTGGPADSAGNDTFFVDAATVLAKAGTCSGTASTSAGGAAVGGVGDTKFAGGSGAGNITNNFSGGGGGGASAGAGSGTGAGGTNGGGGGGTLGGAGGIATTNGGNGGHGGDQSANANITAGAAPGGGGGGRCFALTGATAGANGRVTLTYVAAPAADFTGTPVAGTTPLSVTFTDTSTRTPTSWLWEKNSGSGWVNFAGTPTAQNPTEVFTAGTWSVRMTATNAGGSDTRTRTDYVVSSIPGGGLSALSGLSGLSGMH